MGLWFSGAREQSERLPSTSSPRCGAGYKTHWWESMLEELNLLANKRDVPYQSLLKIFLSEKIHEELKAYQV